MLSSSQVLSNARTGQCRSCGACEGKKDNSYTRMRVHSFSTRPYQYIGPMLPVARIVFVATRLSLLKQNVCGAFIKPNGRCWCWNVIDLVLEVCIQF